MVPYYLAIIIVISPTIKWGRDHFSLKVLYKYYLPFTVRSWQEFLPKPV